MSHPNPWKIRGFGHLKTRWFTIKNLSKCRRPYCHADLPVVSKVVSTHLWNTPRATFTNRLCFGIPFILGERGIAWGVRYPGVLSFTWIVVLLLTSSFQRPRVVTKTFQENLVEVYHCDRSSQQVTRVFSNGEAGGFGGVPFFFGMLPYTWMSRWKLVKG